MPKKKYGKTKFSKKNPKIEKVMSEFGAGMLKSSSGEKVTNRKQAIAIALSEARAYEKGKYSSKKRRKK